MSYHTGADSLGGTFCKLGALKLSMRAMLSALSTCVCSVLSVLETTHMHAAAEVWEVQGQFSVQMLGA